MRTRSLVAAALAVAMFPGVAAARQNRDRRAEQVDRQTRTLAVGASGTLDLETVSGDITVTAGNGQQATVEITRTSRGRTDADARLGLDRVRVEVDTRAERTSVRAVYPHEDRPPYDVTVSYTVTAPPGVRLTAHTVGGNVSVTGIRGQLTAETVGGDVKVTDAGQLLTAKSVGGDVTVNGAQTDGTIEVGTVGGSITVERATARKISINTVGGDVTARDVTCDNAELGTNSGDVEFSGRLARGGRYELHTQSGDVRVMPSSDSGFELQARTFSGRVRTEIPVSTAAGAATTNDDRRRASREVRGTVGDGGALVIARTFSGDVIVGKR